MKVLIMRKLYLLEKNENIIIIGPPGVGNSTIATEIGVNRNLLYLIMGVLKIYNLNLIIS